MNNKFLLVSWVQNPWPAAHRRRGRAAGAELAKTVASGTSASQILLTVNSVRKLEIQDIIIFSIPKFDES